MFLLLVVNRWKLFHANPQKTDSMIFQTDGTVLVFFGAICFYCSLFSGVKCRAPVPFMVLIRRKIVALLLRNVAIHSIETSSGRCLCSMRHQSFSMCNVQHIFKFIPYLLPRALLVDGHPKPFCAFSVVVTSFCRPVQCSP